MQEPFAGVAAERARLAGGAAAGDFRGAGFEQPPLAVARGGGDKSAAVGFGGVPRRARRGRAQHRAADPLCRASR